MTTQSHAEFVPADRAVLDAVVAFDGGTASDAALRWIAQHVGGKPAAVQLVTVVESDADDPVVIEEALGVLGEAAHVLDTIDPAIDVRVKVRSGDPVSGIPRSASRILVIGTNRTVDAPEGLGASLAVRLAATADRPVVVVPATWAARGGPVVVAVAPDVASDAAVEFGADEARRLGVGLLLVLVREGRPPASAVTEERIPLLEQAEILARRRGASDVRTVLGQGHVVDELRRLAEGAQLVVVGRPARSRLSRIVLGSVGRELVEGPDRPVAIVPQPTDAVGGA